MTKATAQLDLKRKRDAQRYNAAKLIALAHGVTVYGDKPLDEKSRARVVRELAQAVASGVFADDLGVPLWVHANVRAVMLNDPTATIPVPRAASERRAEAATLPPFMPNAPIASTCGFVNAFGKHCERAPRYRVVDNFARRHVDCCSGHEVPQAEEWRARYPDSDRAQVRIDHLPGHPRFGQRVNPATLQYEPA